MGNSQPAEANGATCGVCGQDLPPCTDEDNIEEKVIDRAIDQIRCYTFNQGQYYKPVGTDFYYCPTCFWKPRDDYHKKLAAAKEKKQQQKKEHQEREEERKTRQQRQEAIEENIKVTRKRKHVRAQTYRSVVAMPHENVEINHEGLYQDAYELWSEEDLKVEELQEEQEDEGMERSQSVELNEKDVIQKVFKTVLNYTPKENEKIDVPWLNIAQTQLICNYANLHSLSQMEVEIITYCVSQVRNNLSDNEILVLTQLLCLVAKTHPLAYRKTPTTLDDELPGRFMIMLLNTASNSGFSSTKCAHQCVRVLAAHAIKDSELVSIIGEFKSNYWSAQDQFSLLKKCNEIKMPFADQKRIITMVQAYDIRPGKLTEKMKTGNVDKIMQALNEHADNEPNTSVDELIKEIRSTKLIDDKMLDRVSIVVKETRRCLQEPENSFRSSIDEDLDMLKRTFSLKEDEFPVYNIPPSRIRPPTYMGFGSSYYRSRNRYENQLDMYRATRGYSSGLYGGERSMYRPEYHMYRPEYHMYRPEYHMYRPEYHMYRPEHHMYRPDYSVYDEYNGYDDTSYHEAEMYRRDRILYEEAIFGNPPSDIPYGVNINDSESYKLSHYEQELCLALAILSRVVKRSHGYLPRDTQLIALTILIMSGNKSTSRVLEMTTGEGKSTVIAMFAAALALQDKHVDIITSSPILAVRDAEEWQSFYDILRLQASHNTDIDQKKHSDPDKHRTQVYKKNIVYGTVNNFAADILRDEFEQKEIRSGRRFDAVIADEVDLLMLDEGVQFTYLSHDAPILYHLQPLLATIWAVIGQYIPITTITGQAYYMGGAKLFSDVIFESINPEVCQMEDSSQFLVIGNQAGILSGEIVNQLMFDDEKSKQDGKVSESKKEAMSSISTSTITTLLPIFEEYLPYNFEAYNVNEAGLPQIQYASKISQAEASLPEDEKLPVVRLLLLDNGLACTLSSRHELMEAATAKIENSIEFSYNSSDDQENSKVKLPLFLKNLVLNQLPDYINSAFRCLEMAENREYTISAEKKIIPVDFLNSGVMQLNKKWGQGLQQMLEMKHKLCVSSISLVTNFMSHVELFSRYKIHGRIYGLTGTLGIDSQDTTTLLKELFEVHPCTIPTFKRKKLKENPAIIIEGSKKDWYAKTMEVMNNAVRNGRAVLVLCEDIRTAVDMKQHVMSQDNWTEDKVHLYARSDSRELNVIKQKFSAGEVVIATNLAGRGTNIKVTDEVNKSGGLLCLLTFLPRNRRVELQAFGRTARKGKPGSVQCILHGPSLALRYRGCDITRIRQIRAQNEQNRLEMLLNSDVKEVQVKENLFKAHCKYLKEKFERIGERSDRSITIDAINENWGQWLLINTKDIQKLNDEQKLLTELAQAQATWPELNFYHKIKYANNLLVEDERNNIRPAYWHLTEGITMEPTYKAIGYYNRAYVSILRSSSDHDAPWAELRDALEYLNAYISEVAIVTQCISTVHKVQNRDSNTGDEKVSNDSFSQQMQARLQILKFLKDNIREGMEKLQKLKDDDDEFEAEPKGIFSLIPEADYATSLELYTLWNFGMEIVFAVKKKPTFCWDGLIVFLLGVAQIVAGVALAVLTVGAAANFGMGLIAEGVSDCIDGVVAMATNEFSWAEWAIAKAIGIAASLVSGGIAKFATKGMKALKMASKAGKTLKAVPKISKGTWKLAAKQNFKNVMKEVGKEVVERTATVGLEYGREQLLLRIYDEIGEKCKGFILNDLKRSFTEGYLGEVVQRKFVHKLSGDYVAQDRMSPAIKQEACTFFRQVGDEVFDSVLTDPTVQNCLSEAALFLFNELSQSYKGKAAVIYKSLEVTTMAVLVPQAASDMKILLDKLVSETEKVSKEIIEEDEGSQSTDDLAHNSHLNCVKTLKSELADYMGSVYSDILSNSLQQSFGATANNEVHSSVIGIEHSIMKQIISSSKTEAAIKANLQASTIKSMDSSIGNGVGLLPRVAYLMIEKYCSEVEDVKRAGSLMDMIIVAEHYKQGVTVYMEEKGKFIKHSSIDSSSSSSKSNISLLFTPPKDKNGTGCYDLIVDGKIVQIHSEDNNHLFQAYVTGRNPELANSVQGLEELKKDAISIRKAIIEVINENPLLWAEHVRQSLELDQIRQGERLALLDEGKKNIKTRVPPDTYEEILVDNKRHTLYSAVNGVSVEAVRTYGKALAVHDNGYLMSLDGTLETRLYLMKVKLQRMNFAANIGRCYHILPVSGMPKCVGGKSVNTCVLFQLGPGSAGGNAGNAYANAIMVSKDFECKAQERIWSSDVREKIGTDDFTVTCEIEFESLVPEGQSFSEFFKELNAKRANEGKQLIHHTNENALKERLQAMQDIDNRAARVTEFSYTITCGTFVHNVLLNRDFEIFLPESFTEPNQSQEVAGESLSNSKPKVKGDYFNTVPGYRVAEVVSKEVKEQHQKNVNDYKKAHDIK